MHVCGIPIGHWHHNMQEFYILRISSDKNLIVVLVEIFLQETWVLTSPTEIICSTIFLIHGICGPAPYHGKKKVKRHVSWLMCFTVDQKNSPTKQSSPSEIWNGYSNLNQFWILNIVAWNDGTFWLWSYSNSNHHMLCV